MKDGLFSEDGELIYYRHGKPYHAGVVKVDDAIYYIAKGGRAIKGQHIVHREMGNGILKRGTYEFGEDGKLIEGSYRAPRSSSRRNSKKKKKKSLSKNQKRIIGVAAVVLALAVIIAGVYRFFDQAASVDGTTPTINTAGARMPTFDEPVVLCSEEALKLYRGEITATDAAGSGTPYRAFVFEYQLVDTDATLALSEYADMTDAREWILSVSKTALVIDNLKTGTTYYYKVDIDGEEAVGSFETAPSTRFISIPGVRNTRDIGGYITESGKIVKQGMIVRGPEIDGLVEPTYFAKAEDISQVQAQLGFVYDLDLRGSNIYNGQYQSPWGVTHRFYDSPSYGSIFGEEYKSTIKQIFADLADEAHYPMYLHCTHGADRTGTIVFLLQGLLGMSEEDILTEYYRTALENRGFASFTSIDVVVSGLQSYAGNTLSEKIETYLIEYVGVTADEVAAIRTILLEE